MLWSIVKTLPHATCIEIQVRLIKGKINLKHTIIGIVIKEWKPHRIFEWRTAKARTKGEATALGQQGKHLDWRHKVTYFLSGGAWSKRRT